LPKFSWSPENNFTNSSIIHPFKRGGLSLPLPPLDSLEVKLRN